MTPYTHLTPDERATIARLRAQGASIAAIARQPGRARSTIIRELRRNANKDGHYNPDTAQNRYTWPGAAVVAFSIASRNCASSLSTDCMKTGRRRPSPAG